MRGVGPHALAFRWSPPCHGGSPQPPRRRFPARAAAAPTPAAVPTRAHSPLGTRLLPARIDHEGDEPRLGGSRPWLRPHDSLLPRSAGPPVPLPPERPASPREAA